MSMTTASQTYFEENARRWDELRSGYFGPQVRDAAIARAYLRPDMSVVDVGAGTGFISAGLAPLVKKVTVLDGSQAMLDVARENLAGFTNLEFKTADATALPLENESVDAVFANMLLHHIPEPLAAIREMTRVLRPGGRLVITDMDAHPYAWLKEEMADVWQGFEREQVHAWLKEAGLVNRIVDCTEESCCAVAKAGADQAGEKAEISVFVAVATRPLDGIEAAVMKEYDAHARNSSSCCSSSSEEVNLDLVRGYSPEERDSAPAEAAEISLGCGNPLAMAELKPGETVVDIGSGGGLDSFLAAQRVGPSGKVIGVDMTESMLARARETAKKHGFEQVEFRQGVAEKLPVDDNSVDVVLSNCVINLTRDKGKVFDEAYRVLRNGGRLEVSDIVASGSLPLEMMRDGETWAACVSGALPEGEYLDLVKQAGFRQVTVRRSHSSGQAGEIEVYSVKVSAVKGKGAPKFEIIEDASSGCGCGTGCCS